VSDTTSATAEQQSPSNGYEHLTELLIEFSSMPADDPRRSQLRDRLVTGYLPVAQHIARRFAYRGEPLDDLEQVATVGLIHAVNRFEADRGTDFLSYAVPTITGEVRRHFRDQAWSMRVPRRLKDMHVSIGAAVSELSQRLGRAPRPSEIAQRLGIPTEEVLEGLEASSAYRSASLDEALAGDDENASTAIEILGEVDAALDQVEYRESIRPLLAKLPDRERTIVMLRFFGNMTQTQIAQRVGISQMHVSRLLSQTLAQLRSGLSDEAG
jgi:RNA polymerase sigma-B factor